MWLLAVCLHLSGFAMIMSQPASQNNNEQYPEIVCGPLVNSVHYVKDCTKYVECFQGNKFVRTCPNGEFYDESIRGCDLAVNNPNCDSATHMRIDMMTTTPATNETNPCAEFAGLAFLPMIGDCTKFIQCDNRIVQLIGDCPPGKFWNGTGCTGTVCITQTTGGTGSQTTSTASTTVQRIRNGTEPPPVETTTIVVTTIDPFPDITCPPTGHFATPTVECPIYVTCTDGRKNIHKCPNGFYFVDELAGCDRDTMQSLCNDVGLRSDILSGNGPTQPTQPPTRHPNATDSPTDVTTSNATVFAPDTHGVESLTTRATIANQGTDIRRTTPRGPVVAGASTTESTHPAVKNANRPKPSGCSQVGSNLFLLLSVAIFMSVRRVSCI